MEIVAFFRDFGYPAIVSGVLLWLVTVKLEKIAAELTRMNGKLEVLLDRKERKDDV